ncbi:MAG: diguanylate cyclase, partial [Desulfobacterales bacterium]|nr:diguanylate cyclase [Desulfobacterales bacterium]
MMAPLTLSKPAPDQPALNFALLRAEGLGYLERLSHRLWNDFNIHDPGITILEALCYALTELGYRANFPIQDLLARPDRPDEAQSPLFPAEAILPCRPVTLLDWRKLLVDLDGVQNAWLMPAEVTYYLACRRSRVLAAPPADEAPHRTLALKGLYDVRLEVDETIDSADPEALAPIYEAVRQQLHRHRNLCEDFVHIGVVPRKEFKLCAEIELAPEADADLIEAQILLAVQDHLTPPILFYSLEEMTARGKTRSQIFEGPRLSKGFVDREELQSSELKQEIRLSDIVRVVMQVPGVTAVGRILLLPVGQTALPEDADKWRIAVR